MDPLDCEFYHGGGGDGKAVNWELGQGPSGL